MESSRDRCPDLLVNPLLGTFVLEADGTLVDANPAALGMLGLSPQELAERSGFDPAWRILLEDGSPLSPDSFPATVALRTGLPVRSVTVGVFNPIRKAFVWMVVDAIPRFREGESTPCRVFVTLHDISDQKRIRDIHEVRLQLMEFAGTAPDVESVLVETVDHAERLTGSRIGFYHFFDESEGAVNLQAWSRRTTGEFCRAEGKGSHYPAGQAGVWIDCVRERRPVIHNEYASLPHRKGLPPGHAPVVRELVVPVIRAGRIVAILGVGNKECDYVESDVATVSLLADLAWDIADGLILRLRMTEAEKRYRLISNTSLDAFMVVDKSFRILEANEAACAMYGFAMPEILSLRIHDIEAAETPKETGERAERLVKSRYERFETRHRRKDGREIDIEASVSWGPEKQRFFCYFRDISARVAAESRLREQERWLRESQEAGGVGSYRFDLGSGCWTCTEVLEEIFGIDPAYPHTLAGWVGIVHPDERDGMAAYVDGLVAVGGLPFDREYRILRPSDGQVRWLHGRGEFIKGLSGPECLIGTITDTTDRRKAQTGLEEANRRLDLALGSGGLGVWEYDLRTGALCWDDRMFDLYGIDPGRFRGLVDDWLAGVHPEDRGAANRAVREAIEGHAPYDIEFRIVRPDGAYRHVKADGIVVRDAKGNPLRMIGINRDVTAHRQIEEQFLHAQRMESIGQLAGGVAHDFNNVLQVIMGNALLLRGRLSAQGAEHPELPEILSAVEKGAGLTRSLLAFGRKQSLNRKMVDLGAVVGESAKLARRLVEESLRIDLDLSTRPLPVEIDAALIQHALFNLVTNARDAMENRGTIRIRTFRHRVEAGVPVIGVPFPSPPSPGIYAAVGIRDTAGGIPANLLPRIFEPFFTTKERGKGTGLGLSMVHGTVVQHNGFLLVDSLQGNGTEFTILLPLKAEATPAGDAPPPNATAPTGRGRGILIAEDDDSVRDVLVKLLTDAGYRVFPARNGEEAVAEFERPDTEVELLILDVVMPEMDGPAAYDRIQARRPEVPAIFLSGYGFDLLNREGAHRKVEVVSKPVDARLLLERIAGLLERNAAG